jgi:hypothetical protein
MISNQTYAFDYHFNLLVTTDSFHSTCADHGQAENLDHLIMVYIVDFSISTKDKKDALVMLQYI